MCVGEILPRLKIIMNLIDIKSKTDLNIEHVKNLNIEHVKCPKEEIENYVNLISLHNAEMIKEKNVERK